MPTMHSSLSVDVFDNLHELLHIFRAHMQKSMEAIRPEMTFNEMRILMHTGRQPGITQKNLVEHSHTDKAQMARTLALLEGKGWLTRSASESDRRVRCLQLSTQGKQLFVQLRDLQEQIATELLQDCSPQLQTQLLALLQQAKSSASTHTDVLTAHSESVRRSRSVSALPST